MKTAKLGVPALLVGTMLAGAALLPTTAHAQERVFRGAGGYQPVPAPGYEMAHPLRGALTWSGDVDDTVVIEIHGQDARTRILRGKDVANTDIQFDGRLPDRPIHVILRQWNGRGEVHLVQEPNPDNDFTAVVRIHDPQGGRGHYAFTLAWRPRDNQPIPDDNRF